MKILYRISLIVLLFVLLFLSEVVVYAEQQTESVKPRVTAAVIVCDGMIDDGLYKSIRRRSEQAIDSGAQYLIYEISTYGGLVKSADDIAKYFIMETGRRARTIAYVKTEAISAGAMIAVSCQDIIMLENTTIGDCAPITPGAKLEGVEREKAESFIRAAFDRAAEANNYPPVLLKAMVSMQTQVYRIKNKKSGQYEFFESKKLPKDKKRYDLENKELIVDKDEILALTALKAFEYGLTRAQVKDLTEAMAFLAQRDNVEFAGEPIRLKTNWSEEMVRWLNSPAVMGILIMLAMLGIYMELSTPGVGLPGLVAVIAIVIIVGSKYFIGLANWLEVAIFIVGIILLAVEVFVLPGFGVAGITGLFCMIAGLFGMLIKNPPGEIPWPQTEFEWSVFNSGALGLLFGFVGFIIFAWILSKYLPKVPFLSGLLLKPAQAKTGAEMEVSMTTPAESALSAFKIEDKGRVLTPLRPAGKAQFADAIVDVVAEGEFLDRGVKIEIIEIHGNRVLVKPIDNQQ